MTTTTTHDLSMIAAAGLGRKAQRMTVTTDSGMTRGVATNDTVWVDVVAATGDAAGGHGSVPACPVRSGVDADARFCGRDLRRIVSGIVPATDAESCRYALGGTLVEIAEGATMAVVGTDGKRMHVGHIQPSAVYGQSSPIVSAGQWKAIDSAVRAALRAVRGLAGRKLEAAADRGAMRIVTGGHTPTGGEVVTLYWEGEGLEIQATALAVAGRFPRWRDCLPENAPADWQKPQQTITVDVAVVARQVAEYAALHRAAEKAARAAWKAEREERKRQRRYHGGDFLHPMGVDCRPDGMTGTGAVWSSTVPATPVAVRLDHTYVADALAGAAAWGAAAAVVSGSDSISAVTLTTGEHGPQFLAVIMPLAAD